MAILSPFGPFRAFDDNGDPLSGGKLYTYEAGTSTPKATYTNAGGLIANANPVVLDSTGYANVWLGDGGYKFILQTSAGATLWTIDDIGGDSTNAFGGAFTDNSGSLSISTVYKNGVIRQTGAGTLSLLPAATAGSGFYFIVRKDTASTVTIDPNLSETINGASTLSLVSDAVIICNGTAWYTLFMQSITAAGTNTFTGTNTFSAAVQINSTLGVTGKVTTAASATGGAGIILTPGVAPTSPVNGDLWVTSSDLQARVGSVTKTYKAPTYQYLTSGAAATYTTPAGATGLLIKMVGGGGGGGATATNAGGNGGNTIFNSINAAGGSGGPAGTTGAVAGGAGGTGGSGSASLRLSGGDGHGTIGSNASGGWGAGTPFGSSVPGVTFAAGKSAKANTGCGGAGGSFSGSNNGGGGGGSGEYVELYISSPAASYTYTIGAAGAAGAAGTFAGGTGGTGLIIVQEFYN